MEQIKQILMSSKELIKENYTASSWEIYEKAFYHAYDCLKKESDSNPILSLFRWNLEFCVPRCGTNIFWAPRGRGENETDTV